MTPTQFRKRTSQLSLSDETYEKYEQVCKQCKICSSSVGAPSRSHVSGIRAENFGEILFVDHCEVKIKNVPLYVFIAIDGSTSLLWAQAQQSL
jgi:hypothetical protein